MDFEEQLRNAISRGQRQGQAADDQLQKKQLSESELRQRHTDFRLKLSDHIEKSLKQLPEHFPGFAFETVYGDRGWGGALYRDDLTTNKSTGQGLKQDFLFFLSGEHRKGSLSMWREVRHIGR